MARAHLVKLCAVIALLLTALPQANALVTFKQLDWSGLSAEQKAILSPLKNDWESMESQRKREWVGIAHRYGSMTPEEKLRIQLRMKEWARLSPRERQLARDNFTSIQNAPQEHRSTMKEIMKQQWQEYQSLPESEKEQLRRAPQPTSGTKN